MKSLFIALFVGCFTSTAWAGEPPKKVEEINFDETHIEGKTKGPSVELIPSKKKVKHDPLLKIKKKSFGSKIDDRK